MNREWGDNQRRKGLWGQSDSWRNGTRNGSHRKHSISNRRSQRYSGGYGFGRHDIGYDFNRNRYHNSEDYYSDRHTGFWRFQNGYDDAFHKDSNETLFTKTLALLNKIGSKGKSALKREPAVKVVRLDYDNCEKCEEYLTATCKKLNRGGEPYD